MGTLGAALGAAVGMTKASKPRKIRAPRRGAPLNRRLSFSMKLALEKEDQNVLAAFMDAFAPAAKVEEIDEQKQKDLMAEFDQEEEKLKNSPGLWNPFG
mmetsp:Transcript_1432/g.1432  ORF Transcript_1432/g.1432 Transcript_1432/m.1432 type:complete len:99 (-) Transcript_1432:126-422(-)